MKILVTGNLGYIGPTVMRRLRASYPDATLVGLDMGYFATCLTAGELFPENSSVDLQYFCDIRRFHPEVLNGVDAIVYLAAISNDPMGATFESVTLEVNYKAAVRLAQAAKENAVKAFIFASSCSVYGCAESGPRTEDAPLNPLTAYAKSKVSAERDLAQFADKNLTVTCLRFATACGMSERLRLDLVLNDFVASAIASGGISILSDGTPWRPLIHIKDMAKAIDWGIRRKYQDGGDYLAINVGSDQWNYQVKDLALAVKTVIPDVKIDINKNAQPDKRSYQVSFEKFSRLAPDFQPEVDLICAVKDLKQGLQAMKFQDKDFRSSRFMRLNVLKHLREGGHLTEDLEWVQHGRKLVEA